MRLPARLTKRKLFFSLHDRAVVRHPLFWLILFARFGAAGYILIDPLWGFVATLVFDYADALTWMHTLGMSRKMYYLIDKPVDWVSYIAMYAIILRLGDPRIIGIASALLLYRFVGQMINWITHEGSHFIWFPNFFEVFFGWVLISLQFGFVLWSPGYFGLLLLFFCIKELQEVGLYHVWPAYLRRHGYPRILRLLGQTKKVRWT